MEKDNILFKVVTLNRTSAWAVGKYSLSYKKGETVERIRGTVGLFCFDNIDDVYYFKNPDEIIITILAISNIKTTIPKIPGTLSLNNFYRGRYEGILIDPPKGTVLCDKLIVLS